MPPTKDIPSITRYVTGHNSNGLSIITSTSETPPTTEYPGGMEVAQIYSTQGFPANLENDQDLQVSEHLTNNPPGIVVPNGSACRMVDLPPGFTTEMHRSMSVNYNTVIEGEIELLLDSGKTRQLKRGDTVVQRAIKHGWRNMSSTSWARMTAIVVPAELSSVKSE